MVASGLKTQLARSSQYHPRRRMVDRKRGSSPTVREGSVRVSGRMKITRLSRLGSRFILKTKALFSGRQIRNALTRHRFSDATPNLSRPLHGLTLHLRLLILKSADGNDLTRNTSHRPGGFPCPGPPSASCTLRSSYCHTSAYPDSDRRESAY